jgi:hypothetical protein
VSNASVPVIDNGPVWPRYQASGRHYVEFGTAGVAVGQDPAGGRLDALERALRSAPR